MSFAATRIATIGFVAMSLAEPGWATVPFFRAAGYGEPTTAYTRGANYYYFSDDQTALSYDPITATHSYLASAGKTATYTNFGSQTSGRSNVSAQLSLNPSVIRGSVRAFADANYISGNPVNAFARSDAYVTLSARTLDRITFTHAPGSTTGIIRLSSFVQNSLSEIVVGSLGNSTRRGDWAYDSTIVLFEDSNHVFGQSGKVKFSDVLNIRNNNCTIGVICFSTGSHFEFQDITVDTDDVLYIYNFISLVSDVSATYSNGVPVVSVDRQFDFGHSGYTLLQPLTPGFDYVAESGVRYLTAVPGTVPESETWAMMIFGFGLIGGVLRRLRYTLHVKLR